MYRVTQDEPGNRPVRYEGEGARSTVDRQEQMIDRLVNWILVKGLSAPAVLFLEASKPLSFIGSQVLLLLQPMLGYIGPTLGWFDDSHVVAEYAELLEDPANIDRILVCLEHRSIE